MLSESKLPLSSNTVFIVLNLYKLKTFPLKPGLFCIKKGLSFNSTSKMIKTNSINGEININIKKEKEKSKKDLNETYLNI